MQKLKTKQIIYSLVGLLIASIGINITYASTIGGAPIEAFNHQLAPILGIKTGTLTIITAFCLLLLGKLLTGGKFQYKGLIGGFILGNFINFSSHLDYQVLVDLFLVDFLPETISYILVDLIGAFLMGLGTVITVENKVIMSYNDAFIVQIKKRFFKKMNVGQLKIIYDYTILCVVFVLSLFISGFTLEIGNFILAFAIGSNVKWIKAHEKIVFDEIKVIEDEIKSIIN